MTVVDGHDNGAMTKDFAQMLPPMVERTASLDLVWQWGGGNTAVGGNAKSIDTAACSAANADSANAAYERCYRESATVSPPPPRPTTYKDLVLSTMWGSLRVKSLVLAPLSRPSTTVGGQLQTACCHSQPCCCVGRRHGPRAPHPQEHLLRGRRRWPRAPNQSTENGWA